MHPLPEQRVWPATFVASQGKESIEASSKDHRRLRVEITVVCQDAFVACVQSPLEGKLLQVTAHGGVPMWRWRGRTRRSLPSAAIIDLV